MGEKKKVFMNRYLRWFCVGRVLTIFTYIQDCVFSRRMGKPHEKCGLVVKKRCRHPLHFPSVFKR